MNKYLRFFSPALSILALGVCATAAYAAQPSDSSAPNVRSSPFTVQQSAQPEMPHALTRREVIDDLIKAEKDGSLQRLNDTVYHGS
ncbi:MULTISPECIES: DUF4148 domain-containing protein [Burkholderia cepacia complex]|uniref:DUF4148 domain-containing protein n=1 Tax=Burkholderia cepacia complex TaxID=87882 RepID=UPI001B900A88|nr:MULTISPECIES: DUF4148 domain-containing protein [Burkholderia cepacia complex]MBR8409036.1 DUF4148 domain-containing protein [Burkholderia cenocepacia]WJN72891.1 hypothetical protein OH687_21540 [Burkholderia anthina]